MREKNSYRNLSPAGFEVEVKENVFIPMPDGIHLAATGSQKFPLPWPTSPKWLRPIPAGPRE